MDQPARTPIDKRQDGRDRRVRRRAHRKCLDEGDAEREARLGVIRQALLRRAVDQSVEIGEAAERFSGDGMGEGAVVGALQPPRGIVERGFERQALAQHRVEQAQGRGAGGRAGGLGAAQSRRLSGSSALAVRERLVGTAARRAGAPTRAAICSSAAIRLAVAGWVEKKLSRPVPGTM